MSIPWPKLLSVITVPTGGWDLPVKVSDSLSLDTTLTCTIPAGDYFMAWDNQNDDFLFTVANTINDQIAGAAPGIRGVLMWIDTDHKVHIKFDDDYFQGSPHQDVEIDWNASDGPSVAGVLGFSAAAADQSTGANNPEFTGDYHHAYGWYADEDGLLVNLPVELQEEINALQGLAPSGQMKTQLISRLYSSALSLQYVPRAKMFSRQNGYNESPSYPYVYNEPFECMWREISQGKRFRIYRDGKIDTAKANDVMAQTSTASQTVTDSGKAWSTTPNQWTGKILYTESFNATNTSPAYMRWYISSSTATSITVPNDAEPNGAFVTGNGDLLYLMDQGYDTFVLDTSRTSRFVPRERPQIDKYDIVIAVRKYVA